MPLTTGVKKGPEEGFLSPAVTVALMGANLKSVQKVLGTLLSVSVGCNVSRLRDKVKTDRV